MYLGSDATHARPVHRHRRFISRTRTGRVDAQQRGYPRKNNALGSPRLRSQDHSATEVAGRPRTNYRHFMARKILSSRKSRHKRWRATSAGDLQESGSLPLCSLPLFQGQSAYLDLARRHRELRGFRLQNCVRAPERVNVETESPRNSRLSRGTACEGRSCDLHLAIRRDGDTWRRCATPAPARAYAFGGQCPDIDDRGKRDTCAERMAGPEKRRSLQPRPSRASDGCWPRRGAPASGARRNCRCRRNSSSCMVW